MEIPIFYPRKYGDFLLTNFKNMIHIKYKSDYYILPNLTFIIMDKSKKLTELNNAIKRLGLTPKEAITLLEQVDALATTVSYSKEEIFNYVKNYLEKDCFCSNVQLKSNLIDDLAVDMIDVISLMMALELNYSIKIEDCVVEKWVTIEDIVNSVYQLLQK